MTSVIGATQPISASILTNNNLLAEVKKEDKKLGELRPAEAIQNGAKFFAKLLRLGGKFVEFSGRGVDTTITTRNTEEAITVETKTVLNRAKLAEKLGELGTGAERAVENLDQGVLTIAGEIFTPKDLGQTATGFANFAKLFFGRKEYSKESTSTEVTQNTSIAADKEVVNNVTINDKKAEDKPAQAKADQETLQTPAANLEELFNVIKANVPAENLEDLKKLNDETLLALVKGLINPGKTSSPDAV